MDWMWEYYTYMSRAEETAKELAEAIEKIALAAGTMAEDLAALMRELGALVYTRIKKRTRAPRRRRAAAPLVRPWRARRLAMQQNRPPGIGMKGRREVEV